VCVQCQDAIELEDIKGFRDVERGAAGPGLPHPTAARRASCAMRAMLCPLPRHHCRSTAPLTIGGEMRKSVQTVQGVSPAISGSKPGLPIAASPSIRGKKVLLAGASAYTDAFTRAGGSP
jgi:hypothetical protein